jgi:hypothetical protein
VKSTKHCPPTPPHPKQATTRQRLNDVVFIGLMETLVAGSTLIYCLFLMPLFFMMESAWFHLAWLCFFHVRDEANFPSSTHTHTHARKHAHAHTHTNTHAHANTHTHAPSRSTSRS